MEQSICEGTDPVSSPTGKLMVPAIGPLDATVVAVAESPAAEEVKMGIPLVGRAGQTWNEMLRLAGLPRDGIRIVNRVPCRAPQDKFALHDPADLAWGDALLAEEIERAIAAGARIIMPMGASALDALAPDLPPPPRWDSADEETEAGRITAWRGSWVRNSGHRDGTRAPCSRATSTACASTPRTT